MIALVLLSSCVVLTTLPDVSNAQNTLLALPEADLCVSRPKQWQWTIDVKGKPAVPINYYFSWHQEQQMGKVHRNGSLLREKVNWLEARNECRKRCMDSVGIETFQENELILEFVRNNNADKKNMKIPYFWTSGRLCDFTGCDARTDLKPLNVNGWFFSNSNTKCAPTNKTPPGWTYQPWSNTGHTGAPQPDNAEFDINQTPESCLGVLNDIYSDGITWHDIACYHKKPYICEDSPVLIEYIKQTHPDLADSL